MGQWESLRDCPVGDSGREHIWNTCHTLQGGSFVGDYELEPIAQEDLRAADRN